MTKANRKENIIKYLKIAGIVFVRLWMLILVAINFIFAVSIFSYSPILSILIILPTLGLLVYHFIFKSLKLLDFFGSWVGISLFYMGASRISMGINSIRTSDYYTSHFMNVGLMYIYFALLILIIFAVRITYSLTKKGK